MADRPHGDGYGVLIGAAFPTVGISETQESLTGHRGRTPTATTVQFVQVATPSPPWRRVTARSGATSVRWTWRATRTVADALAAQYSTLVTLMAISASRAGCRGCRPCRLHIGRLPDPATRLNLTPPIRLRRQAGMATEGETPVLKKLLEFLTLRWLWDRHRDKR